MARWNGQLMPVDIRSQTVDPSQHELHVAESDGIEFHNHDPDDYFIQVFSQDGKSHAILGLFVPSRGSGALIVDGAKGDQCTYNIVDPRHRPRKKTASGRGTHVIVITSSGTSMKKKKKTAKKKRRSTARS